MVTDSGTSGKHAGVSPLTYTLVFALLLLLTAATVLAGHADLGAFNTAVALGIACLKAVLVLAYFMHLRHGSPVNRLVAAGAVFWLLLLVVLTLGDFLARD